MSLKYNMTIMVEKNKNKTYIKEKRGEPEHGTR